MYPNFKLTNRESEVLELISNGSSTNDIASILYLSPETVKCHRKSLLRKLSAKNGANLIRIAYDLGLFNRSVQMAS